MPKLPLLTVDPKMTYLILSDSHGYGRRALEVLDRLSVINLSPQGIIFLGDGTRELLGRLGDISPVYAVLGNCDGFIDLYDSDGLIIPEERLEIFDGKRILMLHGHRYSVKGGLSLAVKRAAELSADVLLFGHTHSPLCTTLPKGEQYGDVILSRPLHVFNPGALMERSFGLLTIQNGEILLSHGRV